MAGAARPKVAGGMSEQVLMLSCPCPNAFMHMLSGARPHALMLSCPHALLLCSSRSSMRLTQERY